MDHVADPKIGLNIILQIIQCPFLLMMLNQCDALQHTGMNNNTHDFNKLCH